ncbi:MAG: NAD-dependent malic enzyme [Patescibacteria group bacterium]|nr:NAD-dependent malic enzyme [Patescibacteria group bacterium]
MKKKTPFDFSKEGKIEIKSKHPLTLENAHLIYTPGIAEVVKKTANNPKEAKKYTWKNKTVAIVTDGTAVLGLGDQGPLGALPVMEGKSVIFKELGGINAIPILLSTKDPKEIIQAIKAIAPSFGGINIEDIAAPNCFEISEALQEEQGIPVFHDDQFGTAIVTLAGLINATKVVGKKLKKLKVVLSGSGAAGSAVTRLMLRSGIKNIIIFDSKGAISNKRKDLHAVKRQLAQETNPKNFNGSLHDALKDADVFIGLSKAGLLKKDDVVNMSENSIVFAMANPSPESMPNEAKEAGAKIIATGRSDFPNQINNALVFPGIFKGALEGNKKKITIPMMIKAAKALAGTIKRPTTNKLLPNITDKKAVKAVADSMK